MDVLIYNAEIWMIGCISDGDLIEAYDSSIDYKLAVYNEFDYASCTLLTNSNIIVK